MQTKSSTQIYPNTSVAHCMHVGYVTIKGVVCTNTCSCMDETPSRRMKQAEVTVRIPFSVDEDNKDKRKQDKQ